MARTSSTSINEQTRPMESADGIARPSHRDQNRLGLVCSRAFRLPRRLRNMTTTARTIARVGICGRIRVSRTASSRSSHLNTFRL